MSTPSRSLGILVGRKSLFLACLVLVTILSTFPRSFGTAIRVTADTAPMNMSRLTYHGGPILSNSFLYVVFWGSDWLLSPYLIQQIYSGLGTVIESGYLDGLDQYGYGSLQPIGYTVNEVVLPGNTLIKEDEIRTFVTGLVSSNYVPKYNSQILLILPARHDVRMEIYTMFEAIGYHTFTYSDPRDSKSILAYSIVETGSLLGDFLSPSIIFSSVMLAATHEIVEAITNPTQEGWHGPLRWPYGEIADLCNSMSSIVTNLIEGVPVSNYWSIVASKCAYQGGTGLGLFGLDISGLPSGRCVTVAWSTNLQRFRMPVCTSMHWFVRGVPNSTVRLNPSIVQVDLSRRYRLATSSWTLTDSTLVSANYVEEIDYQPSGPNAPDFPITLTFSVIAICLVAVAAILRRFKRTIGIH